MSLMGLPQNVIWVQQIPWSGTGKNGEIEAAETDIESSRNTWGQRSYNGLILCTSKSKTEMKLVFIFLLMYGFLIT